MTRPRKRSTAEADVEPMSSAVKVNTLTTRPRRRLKPGKSNGKRGGRNSSLGVFGLAVHSVAG